MSLDGVIDRGGETIEASTSTRYCGRVGLGGLFQFKGSARRGNLKADVVVDLTTSVRPGQSGYPLNAARDALQDRARWVSIRRPHPDALGLTA